MNLQAYFLQPYVNGTKAADTSLYPVVMENQAGNNLEVDTIHYKLLMLMNSITSYYLDEHSMATFQSI